MSILSPSSKSSLIGRRRELLDLTSRVVGAAVSSVTLLGGEAGVGKTRLLTELSTGARAAGDTVLLGHFLDLGDSSAPYLPLSEMFARLAQEDHALAQRIVADRPLVGSLLPEFYRRDVPADLPGDRGSFFDAVHMVLEELAESAPVVVILEDAHWADRSTRELLTFLFTRGFIGSVSMIVSYRSDDLHRRHPLRPKLAEWSRLSAVHRMVLDPLTDAAVRDLLHELRPEASRGEVATIIARAGGNPFFAEELVAVSELERDRLPEELADLLLVRIDALDDQSRGVVRAASVSGRGVDHTMLARVVDLPPGDLERSLRTVVENHVFEVTADGQYAFRHALLGEAVYDDLLPGERVELHRRFAEVLPERSGASVSAALARHARGAGNHQLAAKASVQAGDEAMAAAGPADAARHYEDALSLLAEQPGLGTEISHTDLVLKVSSALVAAGDPDRAADLVGEAYDRHDGDLRERARLVASMVKARLLADVIDVGAEALREAISWVEDDGPTPLLADLQATLARALIDGEDYDGAVLAADEASSLGRELDLPTVITDAMTTLARLDDFTGDSQRAERSMRAVVVQARADGHSLAELRALHQLARVQARMGHHRNAYLTHVEGYRRARTTGNTTYPFGFEHRVFGALYALMVGEWKAADGMLDADTDDLSSQMELAVVAIRMVRDARRGEAAVLEVLPRLRPFWRRDMFICVNTGGVAVDTYGARGDLAAMLRAHDEVVEIFTKVWSMPIFDARIRLSAVALGHLASEVVGGRADRAVHVERADALSAAAEEVVTLRRTEAALGLESRAWLARARAERAHFEWAGRGAAPEKLLETWRGSVSLFDEAEDPYEAGRSRLRLAEILSSAGRRPEARAMLDQVAAVAERLGATALLSAAAPGRSRAGSPARTSPTADGSAALTKRENEVLELVAEGRSNGEIAAALFISIKTVSVHVSNIMAKVGASSRTEAVAKVRGGGRGSRRRGGRLWAGHRKQVGDRPLLLFPGQAPKLGHR